MRRSRLVAPQSAMAQEFGPKDVAPVFRGNGTLDPRDADYVALREDGFAATGWPSAGWSRSRSSSAWRSCARCRRAPRSPATTASRAGAASASGRACRSARCSTRPGRSPRPASSSSAASTRWTGRALDGRDTRYYESIDLEDAHHPQTHPRLRAERQAAAGDQRRADALPDRAPARLQARQVREGDRAGRELRRHPRRQGRLLGGRRLRVVRRDLSRLGLSACASSRRRGCCRARRG